MRSRLALILAAGGALALGGCAYDGLGLGVGYGGGSPYYGYGDPYYGYGLGYGGYGRYAGYGRYGGYGYGPYGGYGVYPGYYGGFGYSPYYGWYDGFYYPGTGYYVYDRDRKPHRMNEALQRYWESRQKQATTSGKTTATAVPTTPDFSGFTRPTTRSPSTSGTFERFQANRARAEQARADRQAARVERQSMRSERMSTTRSERLSTSTTSTTNSDRPRRRRD